MYKCPSLCHVLEGNIRLGSVMLKNVCFIPVKGGMRIIPNAVLAFSGATPNFKMRILTRKDTIPIIKMDLVVNAIIINISSLFLHNFNVAAKNPLNVYWMLLSSLRMSPAFINSRRNFLA